MNARRTELNRLEAIRGTVAVVREVARRNLPDRPRSGPIRYRRFWVLRDGERGRFALRRVTSWTISIGPLQSDSRRNFLDVADSFQDTTHRYNLSNSSMHENESRRTEVVARFSDTKFTDHTMKDLSKPQKSPKNNGELKLLVAGQNATAFPDSLNFNFLQ